MHVHQLIVIHTYTAALCAYPEFEGVNTDESSVYYETAGDLNCYMHVCIMSHDDDAICLSTKG